MISGALNGLYFQREILVPFDAMVFTACCALKPLLSNVEMSHFEALIAVQSHDLNAKMCSYVKCFPKRHITFLRIEGLSMVSNFSSTSTCISIA